MKKRQLEMALQRIEEPKTPDPRLEQYMTPASIAADALYLIHGNGDLEGRTVMDLGCGTGRLSIGAVMLAASKVAGIDVDPEMVELAKANAAAMDAKVEYSCMDVTKATGSFDVVVMNPPFGSQRRHADRPFVERAVSLAPVVYSFHLSRTEEFIDKLCRALGAQAHREKTYSFELRHTFDFHSKEMAEIEVTLFRITRGVR